MKSRLISFAVPAFAGLLLPIIVAETRTVNPAAPQQPLQLQVVYKCNGERLVVLRCRTETDDAWCSVQYPDRKGPATNYLVPELAEKRGDVIRKLQACGALAPTRTSSVSSEGGTSTDQSATVTNSSPAEVNRELGDRAYDAARKFEASKEVATAEQSFRKAIEYYRAAIALDPNSIAYYRLGSAYFKVKEYRAALSAWKTFRVLKPEMVGVLYEMSAAHRALKQYDQAMALVQDGIRLKPDRISLQSFYGELGMIYFELKEYEKALAAYQESARILPATTRHREMGNTYYHLQRYAEALAAYKRATVNWIYDVEAYSGLGHTYVRMGMKDDALAVYRTLSKLDKESAQKLYDEINKKTSSQSAADGGNAAGSATPEAKWRPSAVPPGTSAEAYYEVGERYYKAKDSVKAIEAYKKATALKPSLVNAHLALGYIYLQRERYELAIASLKQAVALKPDDGNALLGIGDAQRGLKHYAEALAAYRNASRIKDQSSTAYLQMGRMYINDLTQPEKAVVVLREALRLKPDYPAASFYLGIAYLDLKQDANALAAFQQAVSSLPDNAEAHLWLGVAYLNMGKRAEAEQVSQKLKTIDKKKAEELDQEILASIAAEASHPEKPNTVGNPATAPTTSAGRRSLPARGASPVQAAPGDLSGPRQPGSRPPSAASGTAEAYYELGGKYREAKDYVRAIEAYKKAIAYNPTYRDASLYLALCYNLTEQWQLAISALKHYQALGPMEPEPLLLLGQAYFKLKQYDEALKTFRSINSLKPDAQTLSNAHFWIGRINDDMGQYENAVSAFQEALRINPNSAQASRELGSVYYRLKQYPQAVAAFQQAVRLNPTDAVVQFNLGFAYVEMGKKEDALQVYRTLQTIDEKAAQKLLAEINKSK